MSRFRRIPDGLNVDRYEVSRSGCHIWQGAVNQKGYGVLGNSKGTYMAHRVAYTYAVDEIGNRQIDHLCGNPSCVNPEHLEPVTDTQNVRRSAAAKLSQHDVAQAKQLRRAGSTYARIADALGVDPRTVSRAVRGITWRT